MATVAPNPQPLDARLVELALALLDAEGLDALSLRRLAREAGVSHGAPLRHFPSLGALRSEVAARGFARLSAAIAEASARLAPGAGPRARLAAAGRAYARIAVAHPALFALMFRPDELDLESPAFQRESVAAFEQLVHHVRAAQDTGWRREHATRELAGAVWSAVHGFASLWAQGALEIAVPAISFEAALRTTLELVLETETGETP